jgi:hypothetical protein
MTVRIITDSNGRKHITNEPLLHQPAPVQPVWIQPDHLQKAQKAPFLCRVEPHKRDDFVPLYTTPPAAQPAPVQEPVAFFDWYDNAHWGNEDFKEGCHRSWNAAIKYTTPPAAQRQWVGLTDEEIEECVKYCRNADGLARAIEDKLKEKNT